MVNMDRQKDKLLAFLALSKAKQAYSESKGARNQITANDTFLQAGMYYQFIYFFYHIHLGPMLTRDQADQFTKFLKIDK